MPGFGEQLETDQLGIRRAGRWILHKVSLRLPTGVIGVLGPNGAGKSVLLGALATAIPLTEGRITVGGQDIRRRSRAYRKSLGYAPQRTNLPAYASAADVLFYLGALKGLPAPSVKTQMASLSVRFNMESWLSQTVGNLSGGMRRRLLVSQAFLGTPSILLLDEPSVELDFFEKQSLQQLIGEVGREATVLVSTHLTSDIETIAAYVIIVAAGRIVYGGTPAELIQDLTGQVWLVSVAPEKLDEFKRGHVITGMRRAGDHFLVRIISNRQPPGAVSNEPPTLEDAYVAMLTASQSGQPT